MTNRSGNIGTATETAVTRYLQAHGFPHAERRRQRGRCDAGDITGTPGIAWEIKGGAAAKTASDTLIDTWLEQTEVERVNANAEVGVLVVARKGIGAGNAGRWWAILHPHQLSVRLGHPWPPVRVHLTQAVTLLHEHGYGDPISNYTLVPELGVPRDQWEKIPTT